MFMYVAQFDIVDQSHDKESAGSSGWSGDMD